MRDLCIVALGAQSKHLVKALASGHQPAQAPEGASTKIAATDSLKLAIALYFEHAHSRADIDKQIWKEILVSCTQPNDAISPQEFNSIWMTETGLDFNDSASLGVIKSPAWCQRATLFGFDRLQNPLMRCFSAATGHSLHAIGPS